MIIIARADLIGSIIYKVMSVLKEQEIVSYKDFAKAWQEHQSKIFEIVPNLKEDELVE